MIFCVHKSTPLHTQKPLPTQSAMMTRSIPVAIQWLEPENNFLYLQEIIKVV